MPERPADTVQLPDQHSIELPLACVHHQPIEAEPEMDVSFVGRSVDPPVFPVARAAECCKPCSARFNVLIISP